MPTLTLDSTGFPMVYVEEVEAYVQLLPLTKIQLELFLAATDLPEYDHDWYQTKLGENPRTSLTKISDENYWGVFASALTPSEAEEIRQWMGEDDYFIPKDEEWLRAYRALQNKPFQDISSRFEDLVKKKMDERVINLFKNLWKLKLSHANPRFDSIEYKMFLRFGVMEWVKISDNHQKWAGYGQTHSLFQSHIYTPEVGSPFMVTDPEIKMYRAFGCRFFRKRKEDQEL